MTHRYSHEAEIINQSCAHEMPASAPLNFLHR